MKKSFTTTLVMLALLAGLIAWYTLYEQKYKPEQQAQEEQGKRLVSLDSDQITEIELTRMKNPPPDSPSTPPTPVANPEYEKVHLKKNAKDWQLIEPVQDQADSATISALLSTLTTTKQERVVDEKPKDLAAYGLKDAVIHVVVKKDGNPKGQEVWVGSNTPVSFSVYAKTATSEAVYKTNRALRSSLDKDLLSLRNKNILNFPRTEISEVEIQNAKENIVLKADEKDNWSLARENLPVDLGEWNKTFNPLLEIRATAFASEKGAKLSDYGLHQPLSKIWFTKKDKSRVILLIGKQKDKTYAKREDRETIFEVDKTIADKLSTPASLYRSKQLALFNRYDITRIKLMRGKETTELQRGDNAVWSFPSEPSVKIDSAQVDSLLTKLQDTKLVNYLPAAVSKSTTSNPQLQISLFDKNQKADTAAVHLNFASSKGDLVAVERTGLSQLFEIKKEDFEKLDVSKQSFLKVEPKAKDISTDPAKKS